MSTELVPVSGLRFRGNLRFGQFAAKPIGSQAEGQEPDGDEASPGDPVDVDLTLISGEPVSHRWWDTAYFDMAGMGLHKETYPLDYCHDCEEIVGQFSEVNGSPAGELTAKGKLIPFAADDRASEIIFRAAAGTPYECSVFVDPGTLRVEFLDDREIATVNGKQVEGPCAIFRQWDLRGAAICPAGTDKYTSAEFSAASFSIPTSGTRKVSPPVSTTATSPAAQAAPVATAATVPAAEAAQFAASTTQTPEAIRAAEAKRYTEAFGAVDGAAFFAAGKTFEQSAGEFAAKLRSENDALVKRLEGAKFAGAVDASGKLAAGETDPLSAGDATADKNAPTALQHRYGKNVGAFMAACSPPAK